MMIICKLTSVGRQNLRMKSVTALYATLQFSLKIPTIVGKNYNESY